MTTSFSQLTTSQTIAKLRTSLKNGLSTNEALRRQHQYGPNLITDHKPKHIALRILWHQLNNLLVYVLSVAAIVTYFLGHLVDTYVIIFVVLVDVIIGFFQEYKAHKSIDALKQIVVATSKVYRDGHLQEIRSQELVPGDLVLIEEGDRVPADGRIIEANYLTTVESSLTGEAFPVSKHSRSIVHPKAVSELSNMVWMSTFVASGLGKMVVTKTGNQTTIGQIAQKLAQMKTEKTYFEQKTARLTRQMSIIALMSAFFTFLIGYFVRGFSFSDIFGFAVASLVSGIPEGLPAILVIVLASGASRMAKKKAIIRSLPATETLSVVDVIATDKTGTLTQNTMTVQHVYVDESIFKVDGLGWEPSGKFWQKEQEIDPTKFPELSKLIIAGGLCSRAQLLKKEDKSTTSFSINGDPTEGALTVLVHKANLYDQLEKIKKINELPFDQLAKFKAVLVDQGHEHCLYASGAPESIIKLCSSKLSKGKVTTLTQDDRQQILQQVRHVSAQAMRTIALAYQPQTEKMYHLTHNSVEKLIFLGFVGMIDPPRPGAAEAIFKAKQAGIRVIMKTGDHRDTAIAIAKQMGIIDNNETYPTQALALTGEELSKLSPKKLIDAVQNVHVFARLTPEMKLKILSTLQDLGHQVAMTGDGVNDVLALKKANIGIAMGKIGTDVAREASDIVLADDNFSSLVDAIEEGRLVFENTRQASAYLITTNFAENVIILLSILFGLPLPLLASQILWLNLVTDGVVDVALAVEPSHGDLLTHKPRQAQENILSRTMLSFLVPITFVMVVICLSLFVLYLPLGLEKARTVAFCAMCFTQLINIFNMRSLDLSIFKIGFLSNRFVVIAVIASLGLQLLVMTTPSLIAIFQFSKLSVSEFVQIGLLSLSVLVIGEAHKLAKTNNWLRVKAIK